LCFENVDVKNEMINNKEDSLMLVQLRVLGDSDRKNLSDLYVKYSERIQAYIVSLGVKKSVAEGLTQDVFVQICCDYAKGRKIKHIEGYLFGLSRNIVYQNCRKLKQLPAVGVLENIENVANQSSCDQSGNAQQAGHVLKAMAGLPAKYREAIDLRYIQNLSLSTAALYAECRPNTFCKRVLRGIRMIRAKLNLP